MKTKFLEKVLKDHKPTCTMNIFSDGDNRHCSCGRDQAVVELEEIKKKAEAWDAAHPNQNR